MTLEFRFKKILLITMILVFGSFISGCATVPVGFDFLTVEVEHKTTDRFLDDVPRSATEPRAGFHSVQHGTNYVLKEIEDAGYSVSSWEIKDSFGNLIKEVASPHELKVLTNLIIVANIECATDDVCIRGYVCIDSVCHFSD